MARLTQLEPIDPVVQVAKAIQVSRGTGTEDALDAMDAVANYYANSPDGAFTETMKQFAYWLLYHRHGVVGEDVSDVLFELWLDRND